MELEALPMENEQSPSAAQEEPDDLFNKLITNLTSNQNLQNPSVREQFKLDLIKDEEDLHNYKNLLNAMAALFYTNHRSADVQDMFQAWLGVFRERRQGALAAPAVRKPP